MMKTVRRVWKRVRKDAVYVLIRLVIGFFRLLPRRAALCVGAAAGYVIPFAARREMRSAVEHLTLAFGHEKTPREIMRLARDMFRHLALNFVDTIRIPVMRSESIKSTFVQHNVERLWEELGKGRGVIAMTSHTGCWEMLGVYLAVIGVPISVIAHRLYDTRLEAMLLRVRSGGGVHTISRGRDTRDIIRALKEGRLLGVLIDQDIPVKGVFVNFFGMPAHTAVAPAQLSLKYGAQILPIFTYRGDRYLHHMCIGEPVAIKPTGDHERDVLALTEACSKVTELFIREHPEQWVWFHQRWKTKPTDTCVTVVDTDDRNRNT